MTAKEKAEELVDKYYWTFGDEYLGQQHIQCELIAVDEILAKYLKPTKKENIGKKLNKK
jgi:hypothetical protein